MIGRKWHMTRDALPLGNDAIYAGDRLLRFLASLPPLFRDFAFDFE
jgi:hypothetical protein